MFPIRLTVKSRKLQEPMLEQTLKNVSYAEDVRNTVQLGQFMYLLIGMMESVVNAGYAVMSVLTNQ